VVATISAALTWGLTRLRHPADLTLLVLDAVALTVGYAALRTREAKRAAPAAKPTGRREKPVPDP
jgi:hypothetical protein